MADRITVVGTLGQEPEERSTSRGPVVQFRLASTDRRRDAQGNWQDGTTSWYRVNVWGELGRNALASLRKGQRVIVAGDLSVSEWEAADGHKARSVEIRAAALGHDLTFGTSSFERGQRSQQAPTTGEQPGATASAPAVVPTVAPAAPPVDHSGEWGVSAITATPPAPSAEPQPVGGAPWMSTPF
jgi:single-strand DNA-binding protein